MAKKWKGGRPQFSISTSIFVRKGKYIKGPSFGLWTNEDAPPEARGSVKDEYLEDLAKFLSKAASKDMSVSFALFKNKKKRDEDEDEDDDDEKEKDEEEDEEEEEEESANRKSKKHTKSGGKGSRKGGKKDDWDFDSDDDD